MTTEATEKAKVKKLFEKYGKDIWYYMPVPMGYGRKGIPDFIGCYRGNFFSVETKAHNRNCTPWQVRENDAIHDAEGKVYIFSLDYKYEHFAYDFEMWTVRIDMRKR